MRPYVLGLLTLVLLLVNEPITINGICEFKKNGTLARCQYFEDINFINTHELKSLKLSVIEKHLSIDVFENLTNLRHLDLSNGKLRKILPGTFLNLRALRSLDLSNNHLIHLENGIFDGPLHLRHLNLRGNSLDRIPPDTRNMKELIFIDLAKNKIFCDCVTLKERDSLRERGVNITNDTSCGGPRNFQGIPLNEPDAEVICMFEKQDQEDDMQKDEPEGSGELDLGDPFEGIVDADVPEDEEKISTNNSSSVTEETTTEKSQETTLVAEIPLTLSSKDDGMYFSEDKANSSSPMIVDDVKNVNTTSETDDLDEGSGIEGSGVGIVPPIDWGNVPETTSDNLETQQTGPKTTEAPIWTWSIFDIFATAPSKGNLSTSTVASPTAFPTNDDDQVNLAQDEFLPVSPIDSSPPAALPTSTEANPIDENAKMRVIDENERKVENELADVTEDSNELPDASSAIQSKKGVGSYLVLAILLVVLVCLIGFAAYRGDFCNRDRKRNTRNPDLTDVENGTELKDLTKSLLDEKNASLQPKISSNNGNKLETVPLVVATSGNKNDTKNDNNEQPTAKYVGAVGDSSADPKKPPRKSYSPNNEQDVEMKNETNGKDVLVNGKHDRDSLSSGSLSNQLNSHGLRPSSPGAQRVKITLQDNPDSVPKTPLLITKIKGGENLVKISP